MTWPSIFRMTHYDVFTETLPTGSLSSVEATGAHQLVRRDLVLTGHQLMYCTLVLQKHLHPNEGLTSLLREHVPGLGPGEQVRDGALGEAQHGLAEQTLRERVLAEVLLDLSTEKEQG